MSITKSELITQAAVAAKSLFGGYSDPDKKWSGTILSFSDREHGMSHDEVRLLMWETGKLSNHVAFVVSAGNNVRQVGVTGIVSAADQIEMENYLKEQLSERVELEAYNG